MYKVIREFLDLQDDKHHYKVGDEYPRKGAKSTLERDTELLGKNNKAGCPLIEEVVKKESVENKPQKVTKE